MKYQKGYKGYMELCLHLDGQENIYLRVPIVWDDVNKQLIGFVKTPSSNTLITGKGKNTRQLQNDFNKAISYFFEIGGEITEEVFGMFMPASYWEDK